MFGNPRRHGSGVEPHRAGNHRDCCHPRKSLIVVGVGVLSAFLVTMLARAGDEQDNPVLKEHKLKPLGSLQVLEDEAEFKTKLTEARRLLRQLNYSLMQQQGTMTPGQYQQALQNMKNELNQMRSQINMLNQQMNMLPRFRGRLASTYAQGQYNEMMMYRSQLQMEVNQGSAYINQLQNQKFDPKAKEKVDAEVRDKREAMCRRSKTCARLPVPSPTSTPSSPRTRKSRRPSQPWERASERSRSSGPLTIF